VWPVGDYGIRKGYALAYALRKLLTPKQLEGKVVAFAGSRVAGISASLGTHRQTDAFVAHVLSWYRWVNARAVSFSDAASPVPL